MKDLIKIFKALSDESRVRILNLLLNTQELCVCDLQKVLNLPQTKVSRHLIYLKNAGLVLDERKGMWVLYSITKTEDDIKKYLMKELKKIFELSPILQQDLKNLKSFIYDGNCTIKFRKKQKIIK